MGLFNRKIEAQAAPQIMGDTFYGYGYSSLAWARVDRHEAMTVPSVKRCRDLICTVGSFPLEYKKISTGEEIPAPRWIRQLSTSQPQFVTLSWLCDSLLMYGVGYLEITSTYQEDGRMASADWVANTRVTYDTTANGAQITQYYVDGIARPMSGVGSLITFQGFNEGILSVGSQTIRAAIDTQRAAAVAASTPMPTGYIRNSGADLPPAEVQGLLAAWKSARQNRSTAYLTSTLSYETASFSPKDMAYTDSILGLSTEIARMCGVPAYYLSSDQNSSLTYSNVLEERKQIVALTLQPYISAIEERLSMDDISTSGHKVEFDLDSSFLKTEPLDRLMVTEKLLALGLIDIEQAKEMEHLTPEGSGN